MAQHHIFSYFYKGALDYTSTLQNIDGIALLHCVSCFSNKLWTYGPLYNLGFVLFSFDSLVIQKFPRAQTKRGKFDGLRYQRRLMSVAHFLTFWENSFMEEKNVLESAFEWICECGAFEQLRKQCEQYTKDFTVSLAPHLQPESSSLEW